MVSRGFWTERIQASWGHAPIVWLSGVRRSGKTTLAKALGEQALYLNCDLPAVEDMTRDPELFYRNCDRPIVVFDEIHQLKDPSRLLKIGADMFPRLKILATGSSTLAATKKFKDTIAGRKRQIHLLPALWDEFASFDNATLNKRLFHGGLPPALLMGKKDASFYREWVDSFFSRDIQKLFAFRDVDKFNAFFEYLMKQSGGLFETAKAASALGISRPTIESHLRALEITQAVTIVRPFHGGGLKELVKTPKCYGFDTGFVSFFRGWDPLRQQDYGSLWEHLVLEWLTVRYPDTKIQHWRDTSGLELDFVAQRPNGRVDVFECKWDPAQFEPKALKTFRSWYPKGNDYIVCPSGAQAHQRAFKGLPVTVCDPSALPR